MDLRLYFIEFIFLFLKLLLVLFNLVLYLANLALLFTTIFLSFVYLDVLATELGFETYFLLTFDSGFLLDLFDVIDQLLLLLLILVGRREDTLGLILEFLLLSAVGLNLLVLNLLLLV